MRRSRIRQANWYDYPQYYDIAFQRYTCQEANFIETACRKYCQFNVRRLLEPACGSGRLITEFAARGYQVTGFDLSRPALSYLRQRLARRELDAETFQAEMSYFRVDRSVDAAYCMGNTFRHLLTEQAARAHLECIAVTLRPGGIYIIGLRFLLLDVDTPEPVTRWTERRGKTRVTLTQRVPHTDLHRRIENVEVSLTTRRGPKQFRLRDKFQLRTYTERQFRRLVASVPLLELCDVYDFRYDIHCPLVPGDKIAYGLFVLSRRSLSQLFMSAT